MKNVLIISGHPNLTESVANAKILMQLEQDLPQAEIRYLDKLYPNYQFDIVAEQEALLKADIIVWQFPFHWYSLPGLMKLWLDKVFLHGFAHGSEGKLSGKKLIVSFTTGAPQELYTSSGFFKYKVEDYMNQFETLARLCNFDFQTPVYTCGISYVGRDEVLIKQQTQAKAHAERLVMAIKAVLARE